MRFLRIISTSLIATSASISDAAAQDAYLCIPDASTGFTFNSTSKAWEVARFTVANRRYVMRSQGAAWSWSEMGDPHQDKCDAITQYGFVNCGGIIEIRFNKNTLRYQRWMTIGYVMSERNAASEGSNTPFLEIGRCSPI